MKKLLIIILFLFSLQAFAQVSNVSDFRIANATTAFGKNLPIGTKVYNVATQDYHVAIASVSSASTLTIASASFVKLNTTVSLTDYFNMTTNSTDDILQGSTNKWNQNHTGHVTGATNLTIINNVIDYDKIATDLKGEITDNDGSFDMSAAAQFNCTPTGNITITLTNIQRKTVDVLLTVSGVTVGFDASIDTDWIIGDAISGDGVYLLNVKSTGTSLSDLLITVIAKQ